MSGDKPDKTTVKWPIGKAYDASADDLSVPIRQLLYDLRLLENPDDERERGALAETPQSLQVLTSGVTGVTNLYTKLATAVGGGGAVLAGLSSFWANFEKQPALAAALMGSAAVLGSAVAIAVALMVKGDVTGRALAHVAEYDARAAVVTAMLESIKSATPESPGVRETRYSIKKKGEIAWRRVKGFEFGATGVVARTEGDVVPATEWTDLARLEDLEN